MAAAGSDQQSVIILDDESDTQSLEDAQDRIMSDMFPGAEPMDDDDAAPVVAGGCQGGGGGPGNT